MTMRSTVALRSAERGRPRQSRQAYILRLPDELTLELFRLLVFELETGPFGVADGWLRMMQVCSQWRKVVRRHPFLWRSAVILEANMTREAFRLLKAWVELVVSTDYRRAELMFEGAIMGNGPIGDATMFEVMDIVEPVLPHCSHLDMLLHPGEANLFALRRPAEWSSLEYLRLELSADENIYTCPEEDPLPADNRLRDAFLNAPHLQRALVNIKDLAQLRISPTITELAGFGDGEGSDGCVAACLHALSQLPNLVNCHIGLTPCNSSHPGWNDDLVEIVLPQLEELCVEMHGSDSGCEPFWRSLRTSNLRSLTLDSECLFFAQELVERSECGDTLVSLYIFFDREDGVAGLQSLLSSTPELATLTLDLTGTPQLEAKLAQIFVIAAGVESLTEVRVLEDLAEFNVNEYGHLVRQASLERGLEGLEGPRFDVDSWVARKVPAPYPGQRMFALTYRPNEQE